ncbi:MAG TPA: GNAT family N-acetyltransferase [Anaerolineales bacterium]|nr:GNAT family N-acetyltransferase [Anaerolineales bacterium]
MPEIRPVTKDNWRQLVKLKVRNDQERFVASNLYSIAEAQFGDDEPEGGHWDMFPFGIYNDDGLPVGFLMYGYNLAYAKMQAFIIRLMVDEQYQGQGYGRFGMDWMLERFRQDEQVRDVGISYEPDNEVGRRLYASLGFVETGEMMGEEVLAVLRLK